MHDINEMADPSPMCCVQGCGCGRPDRLEAEPGGLDLALARMSDVTPDVRARVLAARGAALTRDRGPSTGVRCAHCGSDNGRNAMFILKAKDGSIIERRTIACRPCQAAFAELVRTS